MGKITKRPEQLNPGDHIPIWGEDIEVTHVDPTSSAPLVKVTYRRKGAEGVLEYLPGMTVEVL